MTENRDFLKEFEQLRVETDEIRDALVSKTAHFNNLLFGSGVSKAIMAELKEIRRENKEISENQEKNDKKIEELKSELHHRNRQNRKKIEENQLEMKSVLLQDITEEMDLLKFELLQEIQERMHEHSKRHGKKLSELRKTILACGKDMENIQTIPEIPIKKAILGEWKMVWYTNFEGYKKLVTNAPFERFSQNVKYELVCRRLKQTGGSFANRMEGENKGISKFLYVEGNRLKSFWSEENAVDRYIENGQLHVVQNSKGDVWKRVYEKM